MRSTNNIRVEDGATRVWTPSVAFATRCAGAEAAGYLFSLAGNHLYAFRSTYQTRCSCIGGSNHYSLILCSLKNVNQKRKASETFIFEALNLTCESSSRQDAVPPVPSHCLRGLAEKVAS